MVNRRSKSWRMKILAAIQNFHGHETYCFSQGQCKLWMPVQMYQPCTLYNVAIRRLVDNKMKKNSIFFILGVKYTEGHNYCVINSLFYLVFLSVLYFYLYLWRACSADATGNGRSINHFSLSYSDDLGVIQVFKT